MKSPVPGCIHIELRAVQLVLDKIRKKIEKIEVKSHDGQR